MIRNAAIATVYWPLKLAYFTFYWPAITIYRALGWLADRKRVRPVCRSCGVDVADVGDGVWIPRTQFPADDY